MKSSVCALAVLAALATVALAQGDLTDPYEVLDRHFEALGGLDLLRAEKTLHFEAEMEVQGLTGTVEYWQAKPGRSRTEVDLGVFKQTQGNNGEVAWSVDANGKLQFDLDENSAKRREISLLMEDFEHIDPDSDVFTVALDGIEEVEGVDCYVVRTTNTINDDILLGYYDTETFLQIKSSGIMGSTTQSTVFSDYREVDGLLRAFKQDIEYLPLGQTSTMQVVEYAANPEIDSVIFEPPSEDVRDFTFPEGAAEVVVAFQFIENHLFLTAVVDCREGLWVLDTGASMTVIDVAYAEKLGLELSGSVTGSGAGNAVEVSFATLPPYSVGGIEFAEQNVAVIDIAGLFRRTSDLEIVGILGFDFLSRFATRVDYANETLTFYDPSSFEYEGDGVVLDAPLSGNIFTVPVTVDGEFGGRWALDLGAGGCSFHYPYANEHGLLDRPGVDVIGFGAGGQITKKLQKYQAMEMAGFTVDDAWITVPDSEVVGAFSSTELTGNLGNTLFRHFVLTLDYERQQVAVERGENYGNDFPRGKAGLGLWRPDGDDIEVLYVSGGTPADEAGFEEGDVVVSINGIAVERFGGLIALREMMREAAGTEYVLGILRDGEPMELRLTLRELL
jgi:predicted aspartyl protease